MEPVLGLAEPRRTEAHGLDKDSFCGRAQVHADAASCDLRRDISGHVAMLGMLTLWPDLGPDAEQRRYEERTCACIIAKALECVCT